MISTAAVPVDAWDQEAEQKWLVPRQARGPPSWRLASAAACGLLRADFKSVDGMDVDDGVIRELVRSAERGIGEVSTVGRRSSLDSEDVVKAWGAEVPPNG